MMLDDMPERLINRDGSYTYSYGREVVPNSFVFKDLPDGLTPDAHDQSRFDIYEPHRLDARQTTLVTHYWWWHYEDAPRAKRTPWKPHIEDGLGMYIDNWYNAFIFKHAGFQMVKGSRERYRYAAPYIDFHIKVTPQARKVIAAIDGWGNDCPSRGIYRDGWWLLWSGMATREDRPFGCRIGQDAERVVSYLHRKGLHYRGSQRTLAA